MTALKFIEVDDIDNAKNLLSVLAHYLGDGSEAYAECKRLLSEGFTAKQVAEKLISVAMGES